MFHEKDFQEKYFRKSMIVILISFIFGIIYYLLLPIIFAEFFHRQGYPFSGNLVSYVASVDLSSYFLFIALSFIFLFFGLCSSRFIYIKPSTNRIMNPGGGFILITALLVFLQIYSMYELKEGAFKGYGVVNWNDRNNAKSVMSGLNLVFLFFSMYFFLGMSLDRSLKKYYLFYTLLLVINSIFLLGLGGRLYVLPVFIAYMYLFLLNSKSGFFSPRLVICVLLFFGIAIIMLWIGVVRLGNNSSAGRMVYVLLGESLYNWLGAGSFLIYNKMPFFEIPFGVLTAFIGFVPTMLWPAKHEFLATLPSEYYIRSELGGQSLVYSMVTNFGLIGMLIAFYLIGFVLFLLAKKGQSSYLWKTYFILLLSLVPFMLFRDPFVVFFKNAIFNALIMPGAIIFLSRFRFVSPRITSVKRSLM
ncbi:O-antigen polymerase [Halomonas sp. WWR20]